MRTWSTKKAIVHEIAFDYDLHAFEVYDKESGELVGIVYPNNVDNMKDCIWALDSDLCPIEEEWSFDE